MRSRAAATVGLARSTTIGSPTTILILENRIRPRESARPRADDPDGHERDAGREREPRGAPRPLASLDRPLREERDRLAGEDQLAGAADRVEVATVAPDRDPAERVHQPRARPVAPELDLGEKVQRLPRNEGEQGRIEERLVVRGDNAGARRRAADDLDPVEQPGEHVHDPPHAEIETYAQKRSSSAPTSSAQRPARGIATVPPHGARSAIGWIAPGITVR